MTRRRGFVLLVVIFFTVLLFSGIATFLRRSTLDAVIVRNRDLAARAEALAQGGVNLGIVLLQQDLLDQQAQRAPEAETADDLWALVDQDDIPTDDGGTLHVHIEDAGARIPLNAMVPADDDASDAHQGDDRSHRFLVELFSKVIAEMPGRPEEKSYDPEELANNLTDWLDADDVTPSGEPEDAWYEQQDPPYHTPAEHVLLSVDELKLVRGFDPALVEALRPYVSVYPFTGGGVNPNTAPAWVLAALDVGGATEAQLADADFVGRIVKCRDQKPLCDGPGCQKISDCIGAIDAKPFPDFAVKSDVFRIEARAAYGDVQRTITATVSRKDPAQPEILAWRVR